MRLSASVYYGFATAAVLRSISASVYYGFATAAVLRSISIEATDSGMGRTTC